METEKLDNEIVQRYIKYIQEHLDYLVGVSTSEEADYSDPTKITVTFNFLKQKVRH